MGCRGKHKTQLRATSVWPALDGGHARLSHQCERLLQCSLSTLDVFLAALVEIHDKRESLEWGERVV